jgi:hypothetical protein
MHYDVKSCNSCRCHYSSVSKEFIKWCCIEILKFIFRNDKTTLFSITVYSQRIIFSHCDSLVDASHPRLNTNTRESNATLPCREINCSEKKTTYKIWSSHTIQELAVNAQESILWKKKYKTTTKMNVKLFCFVVEGIWKVIKYLSRLGKYRILLSWLKPLYINSF